MKNVFLACAAGGVFGVCFSFVFGKVGVSTARKLNRGKKTMREGGRGEGSEPCPSCLPLSVSTSVQLSRSCNSYFVNN